MAKQTDLRPSMFSLLGFRGWTVTLHCTKDCTKVSTKLTESVPVCKTAAVNYPDR